MNIKPSLTIQQHILAEQRRRYPQASGEFSWLLSGITLATKIIASWVRRAGLSDMLGSTGQSNVQGETVQKLDVLANQTLLHCLGARGNVAIMASEEDEEPIVVERDREHGKYVVVFDPLDGSSNIDVNVSVGTIFSILRREPDPTRSRDPLVDVLQPGMQASRRRAMSSTAPRPCWFTPPATACMASRSIRPSAPTCSATNTSPCRAQGNTYSVNEANTDGFPEGYRRFLAAPALRRGGAHVLDALHWLAGGGLSSHAAEAAVSSSIRRRSQHAERRTALDVRSQPDRLSRRAGRRPRHGRTRTHSRDSAHGFAPAHAARGRQPRGG